MEAAQVLKGAVDEAGQELTGERPFVLVIDDDADTRRFIAMVLRREYDVLQAANAQEALRWLDLASLGSPGKTRIRCVLLDVLMPGLNGWKLCSLIKKQFDVPVVMLTALSLQHHVLEAKRCGADDFVAKPCSPDTLRCHVSRWAAQAGATRPSSSA